MVRKATRFAKYRTFIPGVVLLSSFCPQAVQVSAQSETPVDDAVSIYRNPRFGISFEIPDNYRLVQGQGAEARAADFGPVPGDSGEYIFAKLERSTRMPNFTVVMPSMAALYFGAHLGATEETCLAPLKFERYQAKGEVVLDGVTFHWSADPFPKPAFGLARGGGFGEIYFRDYAGFASSVCYEFHLRVASSVRESALPQLEAVLAAVELFPRIPVPHAPELPETPFLVPEEVLGILKFAPFQISYQKIGSMLMPVVRPRPADAEQTFVPSRIIPSGGVADLSQSNSITFSYYSDLADGDAATAAIVRLQRDIARSLEQNHWSPAQQTGGSVQDLPSIYRKDGALLEFSRGTGRCTMNSPCTQFDQLTITVFLPLRRGSAP